MRKKLAIILLCVVFNDFNRTNFKDVRAQNIVTFRFLLDLVWGRHAMILNTT